MQSARGGDDIRIFNRLSNSTAGKSGQLLSTFLTKSWPKGGKQLDSRDLDPLRVEFLLTWKPMTGYLKFTSSPEILGKSGFRKMLLIRAKRLLLRGRDT